MTTVLVESRMRGNVHVRFGRRAAETDRQKCRHRAAVRPHFPFTAGRNITLGRHAEHHDQDAVEAAARAAIAHDMITALPPGYDTLLDRDYKDGQELSSGQWQRLIAARVFYRDANLLICDEPSASMDPRAEHALFQQLVARPGRIVVLVTHRLANVRDADQILVMVKGRLVASGSHDQLMAHDDDTYRTLWTMQASGYLSRSRDVLRVTVG